MNSCFSWEHKPTCRHQHHGCEEAHLLLAQAQVHQLLAEVKHGVEQVSGPHAPQGVHAVLLPSQEGDGALLGVKERGEAHHQHLRKKRAALSQSAAAVCESNLEPGEDNAAYLEGAGLQQADLVGLGQVSEARDLLGKLHHLPDGRGEAVGELLPHFVARLLRVHLS